MEKISKHNVRSETEFIYKKSKAWRFVSGNHLNETIVPIILASKQFFNLTEVTTTFLKCYIHAKYLRASTCVPIFLFFKKKVAFIFNKNKKYGSILGNSGKLGHQQEDISEGRIGTVGLTSIQLCAGTRHHLSPGPNNFTEADVRW